LGFPHFSQRNYAKFSFVTCGKNNIDRKLIAEWQGHRNGGKFMDSYTEVFE